MRQFVCIDELTAALSGGYASHDSLLPKAIEGTA